MLGHLVGPQSRGPPMSSVPDSWTECRVDRVGAVRTGLQRSPARQTGRYATKYLRAANVTSTGLDLADVREMDITLEEREVFALMPGDILIAEASGSASQVGRAVIWNGEMEGCCFQNHLIRFRPHAAPPEYALIVFRHFAASGVFARTARGVGIQHLGTSRFAALPFPLAPLAEQRRIAEVTAARLGQIREAKACLDSAMANLEEQVKETVAAATTGTLVADVGERPADRMALAGTHVPASVKEETGAQAGARPRFDPVPQHWTWSTVAEVGAVRLGRQRSPAHHHGPNMLPYLRVANVFEDRMDTTDVLRMNFESNEATKFELRSGDILLNEGQSPELVGRAAIYRGEIPGACFQNTLIRFRAGDDVVPEFALLVFRRYLHAGIFKSVARWSTNIAHLGLRRFQALPFPVPPLEEQQRIAADARRRLDATSRQVAAVTGSLEKVPEIERELFAAAVAGELVDQDPNDEPAEAMLARLGTPPRTARAKPRKREPTNMIRRRGPKQGTAGATTDLAAVLAESGGSLRLHELFARAGFDRDLTEHVERFYLALRDQLGNSLRLAGSDVVNPSVEIIDAD